MTDPIADYLTRLRNAIKAQHRVVEIPSSKLKKEITKILFNQGSWKLRIHLSVLSKSRSSTTLSIT